MSGPPSIEEIIENARALSAEQRDEYLRSICSGDAVLLSRVLQSLEHSTRSWPASAPQDRDPDLAVAEEPQPLDGQRLGPYRFVSKLGSGGMGDVWLAERADEEYQQRVAIKLVRSGLFSVQVHSRLRMERQILATLQHPNIARLLDGGRTSDGTPYLVLEYIDGEPIDSYCNRRRLSLAERIELFKIVCAAVHYAHQNLIVHRDLKPNNILITQDGSPKLLDFGIAKLLDVRHTPSTVAVTHYGYRVMTPAHASPEQVRGETITTASDIYVLGVLLYELLCGRRPFELVGSSFSEMERLICVQDPLPPSAMLERTAVQSPELLDDICACRSITPAKLRKELAGDLDNIVMMAMRKDPARRYSSAEQLAADLNRRLEGLPVLATRDTWTYRSRKFVRRHAVGVASAAAVMLMLLGFVVITSIQSQRIAVERDVARAERTRAEQVSSFLVELFELSDPSKSRGNQVTARELLDIGARRVSVGLQDQPETRATLLGTIGRVYSSLGLYPDSIALLQEALESKVSLYGERHLQVAQARVLLANALLEHGQFEACEQQLRAAFDVQRELAGTQAAVIAPTLLGQGRLAQQRGALDEAERYFEQALAIYDKHGQARTPEAASALNEWAGLLTYRGEYGRAAQLYRTALDIDRRALGEDHPQVAMHVHNLAVALQADGKANEAEPLYVRSTELLRRVLGEKHPQTIDALSNYGRFLHRRGAHERAEEILGRVARVNGEARGARHPYVAHDLVSLGLVRLDLQRHQQAEEDFRLALDIYRESLPDEHPFIASALAGLGRAQLAQSEWRAAEQHLRLAMSIASRTMTSDSVQLAAIKSALGQTLLARGTAGEASLLLGESLPILARIYGERSLLTQQTRAALARVEGAQLQEVSEAGAID